MLCAISPSASKSVQLPNLIYLNLSALVKPYLNKKGVVIIPFILKKKKNTVRFFPQLEISRLFEEWFKYRVFQGERENLYSCLSAKLCEMYESVTTLK